MPEACSSMPGRRMSIVGSAYCRHEPGARQTSLGGMGNYRCRPTPAGQRPIWAAPTGVRTDDELGRIFDCHFNLSNSGSAPNRKACAIANGSINASSFRSVSALIYGTKTASPWMFERCTGSFSRPIRRRLA